MMNINKTLYVIVGVTVIGTAISCSVPQEEDLHMVYLPVAMPMSSYRTNTKVIVAGVDYTEVHDEWMNQPLMKKASFSNTRVVIRRGIQRGQLMVGNDVAMDFPVCLGTTSHRTPVGEFRITEKKVHHVSNLYGASMPYFMRLTDGGIGLHVGPVFRTPQSHGCIRMTRSSCEPLFRIVKIGTPVTIVQ